MTDKNTSSGQLAEKLAQVLAEINDKDSEPYIFSSEEVDKLQSVIAFVDKLRALRWFGKHALTIVVIIGTVIVNWERIKLFFSGGQ